MGKLKINNVVFLTIAQTHAELAGGINCYYFQESSVSALERRDLLSFIDALAEEEFDVNQEYGDDIPKTLLHMAIEEATGENEFVSALITGGQKLTWKIQSLKLSHSMM